MHLISLLSLRLLALFAVCCILANCFNGSAAAAGDDWLVLDGGNGPGAGKHIVLVCGDEEYRSEELIPAMARVLAVRHGFKCTVLFAINKKEGGIDPQTLDNIPGLEALADADLMVLFLRFRELPDAQMKHIIDYVESGRPIVALRTSTHSFNYVRDKESPYAKYSFRSKSPQGGFGRAVLGETWVSHYGKHRSESTRGVIVKGQESHPIVIGCDDIWGPSDVYGITKLSGDSQPLVMGQVLAGMKPQDPPQEGKKLTPLAWTKTYTGASGKTCKIFTTTLGHGGDFQNEGVRRLLVNACYWTAGLQDKIKADSNVDLVGPYNPAGIGVGKHKPGLFPSDHAVKK